MPDSQSLEAEPEMQLLFTVLRFSAAVLLAVTILNATRFYYAVPNRVELGPRTVPIRFDPVRFDAPRVGDQRLVGAWKLRAPDSRFGGLSAIALSDGGLLALSDSGVLFRFPKPGAASPLVRIDELPAGPGNPRFKNNRDSESMIRDSAGRGWWVGFENRNRVWLFGPRFQRVLARLRIGRRWPRSGFEAIAQSDGAMLLIPESGGKLLRLDDGLARWLPLPAGPVSDAASLPDGSLLIVERGLHLDGIRNRLVQVRRVANRYVAVRSVTLRVGRVDNVEGVAVEPRPSGGIRLWLITDDGHQWPQRTLLVALDWPEPASPPR